jgi:hypothetical protein
MLTTVSNAKRAGDCAADGDANTKTAAAVPTAE